MTSVKSVFSYSKTFFAFVKVYNLLNMCGKFQVNK